MENDTHIDNISRQVEEQEVLKSIYGEDWKEDDGGGSWSITLSEENLTLELFVTLTDEYPGQGPPLFQIFAPSLSRADMTEITNILQDMYLDNIGETVIFQWVEKAREWLQDKVSLQACEVAAKVEDLEDEEEFAASYTCWNDKHDEKTDHLSKDMLNGAKIVHGDPISFKKSTFQGHVATVTSTNEVKQVLSNLMENKKIAHATHNMYAFRIYREDTKSFSQDCDDDGETQAGSRMLHLLQIMDARNILVVVSRWYGGVHLGPDRFRFINNAARQVIEKAGLLPSQEQKKKH
ncbi:Protein IMPACT [Frankliniella fusca]|uniref:Protein IMPACT n=1 Tax=Frankliniella fusca TaxID=407009 RepID=A0AAE1GXH4_9NEOP|nr:Protein IMPACT [Frankliniella fusca]